ncbi:MAG TPA: extracellular solute-binding protein [Phototrophicaceae bacterium]|nr:extracellular solute-binding protein [Phototrophicaceae bacterium]
MRFILLICVVAVMGIGIASTNAQAATEAASLPPSVVKMPDQIAGGRPVTISVTNKPPASDAVGLQTWSDQVARFEKAYPNVTVNGSEYTYAPDTFAALVAGGQVPTLFQVYLTDPQKYINAGVAADISTIFNANNLGSVFNKDIINLAMKDGKVYGLPYGAYAMGIGYNISMLKAAGIDTPPATWDELRADAKKLTDRDNGVVGFSFINDGANAGGWHFTVLAYTFGETPDNIIKDNGDGTYTAGFGTGASVQALQLVKDLRWTDDVLPRETLDWGGNGTELATGKAAMVMMAGDQYSWIKTSFPDVDMSNIGFAPLPAGPGGSVSLTGGNMYMVSSTASADEQEAATYFELWRLFDPQEDKTALDAQKAETNPVIGGPVLPLFTGDYQTARNAFDTSYNTLPTANYSAFTDAIADGSVKLQVEPAPAGQDYYAAVGAAVSTILTDQTADPATVLKDTADTFQSTVLDHLAQSATPAS